MNGGRGYGLRAQGHYSAGQRKEVLIQAVMWVNVEHITFMKKASPETHHVCLH
jgi:hypothetical protein